MSSAVIYSLSHVLQPWIQALSKAAPQLDVRAYSASAQDAKADYAIVWKPGPDFFQHMQNLKVIFSLGAGMDHLCVTGLKLPTGVPLVRMVDPGLTQGMVEYAVYMVLRFHRDFPVYEQQQKSQIWRDLQSQIPTATRRVGVLGLGAIGSQIASQLASLGFTVAGWSRSEKNITGVKSYVGDAQLNTFLRQSEILVNVLPSSRETRGLLNAQRLACLPADASVINLGRGDTIKQDDLLAALDSDALRYAALDVFEHEPLDAAHQFWQHPKVTVTPHMASVTNPVTASKVIADNIFAYENGHPLQHQFNPEHA